MSSLSLTLFPQLIIDHGSVVISICNKRTHVLFAISESGLKGITGQDWISSARYTLYTKHSYVIESLYWSQRNQKNAELDRVDFWIVLQDLVEEFYREDTRLLYRGGLI